MYAAAAPKYWMAGWRGVLPLPHARKVAPPNGFTGHNGAFPSFPDVQAWGEENPEGNIALRLPKTVVGIDVDHYGAKRGGDTLAHAEKAWGPLPATWRSTSRIDGVSGIRFFTVPLGTELETVVAFPGLGDIEVVQFFHRYALVWPSIHPTTDRTYQWIGPDGNVTGDIPRPDALPELPPAWLEGLKRESSSVTATADVDTVLSNLPPGPVPELGRVRDRLHKATSDLVVGSRHDTVRDHVLALFRLAEQGEAGVREALDVLRAEFLAAVTKDRSRTPAEAASEFDRLVGGQRGHDLIASTPTVDVEDLLGVRMTPPPTNPSRPEEPEQPDADFFSNWAVEDVWEDEERDEAGLPEFKTSWGAVDLEVVLAGDLSLEQPTVFKRRDDRRLFYPGRVNALVGPPESAKSWMAFHAAAEVVRDGGTALILDFEDTVQGVVRRLLALGLTRPQIAQGVAYVSPSEGYGQQQQEELHATLDHCRPKVIVLDGVNAALTLIGRDLNDNGDVTAFFQAILHPLTLTGAAVITVDHVPKSRDSRGSYAIGAQAKRAMVDGAQVGVDCTVPFGRGQLGEVELWIQKDKQGGVRESGILRKEVCHWARVIIDARTDEVVQIMVLEPDSGKVTSDGVNYFDRALSLKMIQVSQFLEKQEGPVSQNAIYSNITGKNIDIQAAVNMLVELKHVERWQKGKSARSGLLHRLTSPYKGIDPGADEAIGIDQWKCVPTSSQTG